MLLSLYTCKETLARLDDYLDRELSDEEIHRVELHLKICHACKRKFAFEADLQQEIRAKAQQIHAPEGLKAKIKGLLDSLPEE